MAEPADQIVGRTAELGSLDRALAELQRDRWSAVEIVGEPGIGKSRLLAELGVRAEARGHIVLAGSASELEGDLPFGVFVDALDEYVAGLEPRRLEAMDEAARAELPHVLPSLPAGSRPAATLQIERYRTHRAMSALLEALAAAKPLVLLLDDVHWADSGSVELLGSLLRRPPAAPVLVALTVRPRQVSERLGASLQRADRTCDLIRLDLAALDAGSARELLGAAVGAAEAEALYAQSGGNPFYLQELARHPDAPNVAAALGEELTMLDDAPRRVLEGAAVAGDPFEPDLAGTAAGVPEAAVVDALDELLQRDLVRHTDVPRRFRFRHPLVRRAVYEGTPGGWRLGAHERCARALAERGAPAAARAHHVEHAARHGDGEAVAVLREAGEATALRTPAGAARWFTAALRLLPATAAPPERIGLLMPLARAHVASGRLEEARDAVRECFDLVPEEGTAVRVRLAAALAGIDRALGRHAEARVRLLATLDSLPDRNSPDAAAMMVDLAIHAGLVLEYERTQEWGDRALAIVRPLGDRPLIAAAAGVCALGLSAAGMRHAAEPYWEEAAALVDAMPDHELASRLDAIASVATAEGYLDRFERGAAHARRGFAVGRATGQEELLPILIPAFTTSLCGLGRLDEAKEVLDGGVESARVTGNVQPLAWALLSLGLVQVLAGELDAALVTAEESVEVSLEIDASAVHSFARVVHGHVLIERGDSQQGVETLIAATGAEHLPTVPGAWRAWALDHLAQGWLAAGHREAAERAAERAGAVAASTGLRFAAAAAERAQARLALDAGDPAAAAEHGLAAAAGADEVGARVEAGISRVLAGRALAQAGEPERAAAELQRAAAEFEACGAPGRRGEAERELGKLGVRRHRRTRPGTGGSGIESLTERELEVARLVVDRRTNAQIASTLFLSTKTVETHMRNLFHKLGVSSRVDVARTVERADRAGDGRA
jgi:DNA-binding NarL/FixJ family response regulator